LPNIVKIDSYNFELHRFKVGSFFETQYMRATANEGYKDTCPLRPKLSKMFKPLKIQHLLLGL